jgi:hypothetical protein
MKTGSSSGRANADFRRLPSAAAAHPERTIEIFFIPDHGIPSGIASSNAGIGPAMICRRHQWFNAGVDGRTFLKVCRGDFRLRGGKGTR